jgi:hypothetical protein
MEIWDRNFFVCLALFISADNPIERLRKGDMILASSKSAFGAIAANKPKSFLRSPEENL